MVTIVRCVYTGIVAEKWALCRGCGVYCEGGTTPKTTTTTITIMTIHGEEEEEGRGRGG